MNKYHVVSVGLVVDAKSPFWVAQWSLSNGVRLKRSTKVPVAGGMFRGERLSKVQAKNRALVVAQAFAQESLAEAVRADNLSVRELFDKMLAGKLGFEKGYTKFYIYGALGGRLDHTIANVQTLMYIANRGGQGWIIGDCCITAIHNGEARFRADAEGVISVFCLSGEAKGVSIEGLLYPLHDHTMLSDIALGVSNEFTGSPSCVSVKEGTLVIHFGSIDHADTDR